MVFKGTGEYLGEGGRGSLLASMQMIKPRPITLPEVNICLHRVGIGWSNPSEREQGLNPCAAGFAAFEV